jgi:DNA-binding response OmpR family regulator
VDIIWTEFVGKRILVVEDEQHVAMMLAGSLEELGFEKIDLANSIAAAVAAIDQVKPDVVLLDVHVVDGVTRPVGELLRHHDIPFVVMSGGPEGNKEIGALEVPLLQKPFSPAALEDALKATLSSG